MFKLPQPSIRRKGQAVGRAMTHGPCLLQRQVRPRKGVHSHHGCGLRSFCILRWINHRHAGRANLPLHGIAFGRLPIQRQPQNLAQRLVRVLGRRHPLTIAHRQKQILAVRRKGDLRTKLSAFAPLPVAPNHLQIVEARRVRSDRQPRQRKRQARSSIPGL